MPGPKQPESRPAWVEALADGREPGWTPVACGLLALAGWLGPAYLGLPDWLAALAYAGAYVAGGFFSLVRTVRSLRARELDIDLLMLLSALGAATIGEVAEGAALLFLFSLSNSLESRALRRTTRAIETLMELRPDEAMLLAADGSERAVRVETLEPGQVVRVRPGERIPVDGTLRAGRTEADQAAITGESVPVAKGPGDEILAGAINVGGTVDIDVGRPAADSTLARIIRLVEEAREAKAPTQRFIDRFEQGYAATVIFAALVAVVAPLAFGQEFRPTFYRAMTLLVVASPCAVVISTPATILAALAHAARRGLLFKGGAPLEEMAYPRTVAFDKTGTLTRGRPTVVEVLAFGDATREGVLTLAAAVERLSEHHLGRAIVEAAREEALDTPVAENLMSDRGQGAVARIDGEQVAVGKLAWVSLHGGRGPDEDELRAAERLRGEGRTVVFVSSPTIAGAVSIEDEIRPEAAEAVAELKALGVERTLLLTGDNALVGERVASATGIDECRADLLPEDKVDLVRGLTRSGERVVMVGDGVNDAPALASADVGVAMGIAGTDAALETADLVLVRDELRQLAYAIRLARRARRIVRQNLAFACGVIAILVVVTLVRGIPLPLGVIGHEGSTILVVLNGLRLLRPLRP